MWLFIGPPMLSGIGQVTHRYSRLMKGEYVLVGELPKEQMYDYGFMFVLPIPNFLEMFVHYKKFCKKILYMTICETETVHEDYGRLGEMSDILYTPSVFCKNIFEKQFPHITFKVLHLWSDIVPPEPIPIARNEAYTFYTIGNIIDPRKNIRSFIEAFIRCEFPPGTARIILKATCKVEAEINLPFVQVINKLLTDGQMESIHHVGDCYVNCSHSEGVGMGAVEAALRNKSVIITDFGGLKEYVKTPYVVECTPCAVGVDDFLFKKDMIWGNPKMEQLVDCMKRAYNERHLAEKGFTAGLMDGVSEEFIQYSAE